LSNRAKTGYLSLLPVARNRPCLGSPTPTRIKRRQDLLAQTQTTSIATTNHVSSTQQSLIFLHNLSTLCQLVQVLISGCLNMSAAFGSSCHTTSYVNVWDCTAMSQTSISAAYKPEVISISTFQSIKRPGEDIDWTVSIRLHRGLLTLYLHQLTTSH
jgi:hypothetical protein